MIIKMKSLEAATVHTVNIGIKILGIVLALNVATVWCGNLMIFGSWVVGLICALSWFAPMTPKVQKQWLRNKWWDRMTLILTTIAITIILVINSFPITAIATGIITTSVVRFEIESHKDLNKSNDVSDALSQQHVDHFTNVDVVDAEWEDID